MIVFGPNKMTDVAAPIYIEDFYRECLPIIHIFIIILFIFKHFKIILEFKKFSKIYLKIII